MNQIGKHVLVDYAAGTFGDFLRYLISLHDGFERFKDTGFITTLESEKKFREEDYDDDDWMSEFIGTSQDLDMDSITNTTQSVPAEESKDVPEIEEEGDDPFSVNVVQRKARRSKSKSKPEPEPEEDDDAFFGLDDDDFEEEEEVEEKPRPKRKVGRRTAPRNAPKRRPTRRSKSED